MIAAENPVIANSLWSATANPAPETPPLHGEIRVDAAIVGAGFTGLSAALHAAEAGLSVAVIEAQHPGWGASGRNGGQVIPGLKEDPDAVERIYGPVFGPRAVEASGAGPDLVFDLIRRHAITCDAVRSGWIQPAHDAQALEVSRARAAQWRRRGAPVENLDRAQVDALLGGGDYVGGLIDRRGGGVHPLNYALGLARAAQAAGATVHGQTPAAALRAEGDGWVIETPGGRVRARRVALCTNGYSGPVHGRLRRNVIPVRSAQVATVPLSDNIRRSILPGGQVASDTRRLLSYYRLDAHGRLLMGGRGAYSDSGFRAQADMLRRRAEAMFPQIGQPDWSFVWGGFVALTMDHMPHFMEPEPGLHAAVGFNGRGVAFATMLGRILARRLAGEPADALPFPTTDLRTIPLHFLRKPAVTAAVALSQAQDTLRGAFGRG
jgi:glycine/D-amino acid oxidase-like deaminating enzyme